MTQLKIPKANNNEHPLSEGLRETFGFGIPVISKDTPGVVCDKSGNPIGINLVSSLTEGTSHGITYLLTKFDPRFSLPPEDRKGHTLAPLSAPLPDLKEIEKEVANKILQQGIPIHTITPKK